MKTIRKQQDTSQEKDKLSELLNIPDKALEKWLREKVYPAMEKLAARGIKPEL